MKPCVKCGETKSLSEFHTNYNNVRGKTYVRSACKDCENARQRGYANYLKRYKLTVEEFNILSANGCAICGDFEGLCVDHDHSCCPGPETCGECIRGILCSRHNKAEGFLRSSAKEAYALAKYLEGKE